MAQVETLNGLTQLLALTLSALALTGCGAQPARTHAVPPGATRIRCVNPASGAAWDIAIDPARGLADHLPARIGAGEIAWRDPADGGHYDLDLATGVLAVTHASSTGGYVTLDRCAGAAPSSGWPRASYNPAGAVVSSPK